MTLELARIRAISLDLDDTLCPIRPTMELGGTGALLMADPPSAAHGRGPR